MLKGNMMSRIKNIASKLQAEGQDAMADDLLMIIDEGAGVTPVPADTPFSYIRHENVKCLDDVLMYLQHMETTLEELHLGMSTIKSRVEPLTPASKPEYDRALNVFQEEIVCKTREFNRLFKEMFTINPFEKI